MKILSNFDTWYAKKLQLEYANLFGEEYVIVIKKSRLVRYATIFLPICSFALGTMLGVYVLYTYSIQYPVLYWIFWWLVIIWMAVLCKLLFRKYIDFTMDFLLVTPKEVMKFDQQGIFGRVAERIACDKIKSITLKKEWFWASFFNVGSITFLAEGQTETGDIIMEFVDTVEVMEKKIRHVLHQDQN